MQVVYLANNLIEAHLAKHMLEEADIPVFIFGESLLGGAGELPLFGVLRVCVPDPYLDQAADCIKRMALENVARDQVREDDGPGETDALPVPG